MVNIDSYPEAQHLSFQDNTLLFMLLGEEDCHIKHLEKLLSINIASRGNNISITGEKQRALLAKVVLVDLYKRLEDNLEVSIPEIEAAVRMVEDLSIKELSEKDIQTPKNFCISVNKKSITPRSPGQKEYINALKKYEMVFCIGPAGTGKTFLTVACAVSDLLAGRVERIILSRPAIEAGEQLGFLPGDIKEKIDPYLRPLYDALYTLLSKEKVEKYLELGIIEIAPLAYMRGRTLSNAYIILDEAQNTSSVQMKMFLTRLGENSKMTIVGDASQIDLPTGQISGLTQAAQKLIEVPEIHFTYFTEKDVVRHHLVSKVIKAYEKPLSSPAR